MKKPKKSLVLAMTASILCMSLASCDTKTNSNVSYDDYGIASDLMGAELMGKLHDKLMNEHTTYITYGSVNSYRKQTDADPNKSGNYILFYTGKSVSSGGTREHVWACANSNGLWTHTESDGSHYVDKSSYKGGGSDLYHIRPCGSEINTLRGNAKFLEFTSEDKEGSDYYVCTETGGKYSLKCDATDSYAKKVEPADEYKGDIVRILMYIYIHYSSFLGDNSNLDDAKKDYLGDLRLRDVFGSSYSLTEIYKLMIKWNELDPVDEFELNRNNAVQEIQGNRNPFVDHPEYMARCFDLEEE